VPAEGVINIDYPNTVDLASFVDFVSQSLNLKIVYGNELRGQSVVFRPGAVSVPKENLLDLLRSMLRMQDLALVEGDLDGWWRIVDSADMQRHVREIRGADATADIAATNQVVTQVVQISSEDFENVLKYAQQFLSSPKASVIQVPEKGLLIITDYEAAVAKALEVIKLVDVAPRAAQVVTVSVEHLDAQNIADQVVKVLTDKARVEGRAAPQLAIQANQHGGSILLVGLAGEIGEAKELITQLDTPPAGARAPVAYSPKHMSAGRLAKLIDALIAPTSAKGTSAQFLLDEDSNRLYVTAAPAIHRQIEQLLEREDVQSAEPSRPVRIYRPRNRLARELIGTLSEVLPNVRATMSEPASIDDSTVPNVPPGPNRPPSEPGPGQEPPMPPAQEPYEVRIHRPGGVTRVEGDDFTLSYDEHTNAIIAVGPREFHRKMEMLLAELDKRQPQVVIEMTLVAITFNDSLSLAIELASQDNHHDYQSLIFSSFGLSDINLVTGKRAFHPGGGINGIITGPNETPILFRAIAAHGNSRIITTPKVVVSDSTTATIASVQDAPFTSINASDTVATTSFAGYESAGTTLTVTPHIAQGDHLTLDYSFNFSNFTGAGSVGVPPPRTTNTFSGSVEIPDGHTVIVGGLVTENEADAVTEVPLLGRIPGLGVLFQSSDRARTKSRIFAFIRPTILRDDQFADLKVISRVERDAAALGEPEYPPGEYLWMR
jgi:general secretion pathway protein D